MTVLTVSVNDETDDHERQTVSLIRETDDRRTKINCFSEQRNR